MGLKRKCMLSNQQLSPRPCKRALLQASMRCFLDLLAFPVVA
jgi:hypothetical protein